MLAGFEGGTTENGTTTYSDEEKAAAKEKAESWLQAWEDGDSETRWDLYWVPDSDEEFVRGGDRIRELAQHYSKVLLLLAPMH